MLRSLERVTERIDRIRAQVHEKQEPFMTSAEGADIVLVGFYQGSQLVCLPELTVYLGRAWLHLASIRQAVAKLLIKGLLTNEAITRGNRSSQVSVLMWDTEIIPNKCQLQASHSF